MTTNLEQATAILARHREARNWTDLAVANDLVAQFGLDPAAEFGTKAAALSGTAAATAAAHTAPPPVAPPVVAPPVDQMAEKEAAAIAERTALGEQPGNPFAHVRVPPLVAQFGLDPAAEFGTKAAALSGTAAATAAAHTAPPPVAPPVVAPPVDQMAEKEAAAIAERTALGEQPGNPFAHVRVPPLVAQFGLDPAAEFGTKAAALSGTAAATAAAHTAPPPVAPPVVAPPVDQMAEKEAAAIAERTALGEQPGNPFAHVRVPPPPPGAPEPKR